MHGTDFSQLGGAGWLLLVSGLICAFTATISACVILDAHPDILPRKSLLFKILFVHVGMTEIMFSTRAWPILAILVANIGMVPCYLGIVRLVRRLNRVPWWEPIPWLMILRELLTFGTGLGILAASMAI